MAEISAPEDVTDSAAGGEGGALGQAAEAGAADWRGGIGDRKTREFADRFTSPAHLAEAALNFRRKLSNAIVPPGKDASEHEIADFRRKLGVPDSPEGYDVALPGDSSQQLDEGARARLGGFLKEMHKAGATPGAVQAAVDSYSAMVADVEQTLARADANFRQTAEAQLAREWGPDLDRNTEIARRAVREFDDGGGFARLMETAVVDGVKLGRHPSFLRLMACVGRRMAEDGAHLAPEGNPRQTAQERIDDIHSWNMSDDPALRQKYRSGETQAELKGLYDALYGSNPVVGADGRKV